MSRLPADLAITTGALASAAGSGSAALLAGPPVFTAEDAATWEDDADEMLDPELEEEGLAGPYRDGSLTPLLAAPVLERLILSGREELSALTLLLAGGGVSLGRWYQRFLNDVQIRHTAAAKLFLGPDPLEPDDLEAIAGRVTDQGEYLAGFREQIRSGDQPLEGGTAPNRSTLYSDAAWGTAYGVYTKSRERAGYDEARRNLGIADHCSGCLELAALGWVPIDELIPIGDTPCGPRCHCSVEYRVGHGAADSERADSPPPPAAALPGAGAGAGADGPAFAPLKTTGATGRKPKPSAKAPAVAVPTAPVSVAGPHVPGSPILPGRPIAERLVAYTHGDDKVKALADLGQHYRAKLARVEQLQPLVNEAIDRYHRTPVGTAAASEAKAAMQSLQLSYGDAHHFAAQAKALARSAAADILAVPNPLVINTAGTLAKLPDEARKVADEALSFVQKVTARSDHPMASGQLSFKPLPKKSEGRAYYQFGTIHIDKFSNATTAVHEAGHYLEEIGGRWMSSSVEFLKHRIGGEAATEMSLVNPAYRVGELGHKDKFDQFFDPETAFYVGKQYKYNTATEITSMGLQSLYQDPAGFAHADPEYAKFILGVLDGSLR